MKILAVLLVVQSLVVMVIGYPLFGEHWVGIAIHLGVCAVAFLLWDILQQLKRIAEKGK